MLSAAYCNHISKIPLANDYQIKINDNCYQSVNIINIDEALSDHIKRRDFLDKHVKSGIISRICLRLELIASSKWPQIRKVNGK